LAVSLAACVAVLALVAGAVGACGRGDDPAVRGASADRLSAAVGTTTTTEPPTTTTEAPTTTSPPTTQPPPPTTTTAAPVKAKAVPPPTAPPATVPPTTPPPTGASGLRPAPAAAGSIQPYAGLGTWVDVYDWSHYKGSNPTVGPDQVDQMADAGVQTVFLQTAKADTPDDISEPELLLPIIERAHARGMRVVAWYLPTLEDTANDLRRLLASAHLDVDGLAVDIESRKVADVAERNRRLVDLSAQLRNALPGRAIGAIVLPPVVMEVVNPNYWPAFPWRDIAPYYDVWQTMGYWTNRTASSGYRDAYRYTDENIRRLRNDLGTDVPVHPVGGIGDQTTEADIDGFLRAAVEQRSMGGSIYDWRTTHPEHWASLRRFRA
jgi:hypothetical protein